MSVLFPAHFGRWKVTSIAMFIGDSELRPVFMALQAVGAGRPGTLSR